MGTCRTAISSPHLVVPTGETGSTLLDSLAIFLEEVVADQCSVFWNRRPEKWLHNMVVCSRKQKIALRPDGSLPLPWPVRLRQSHRQPTNKHHLEATESCFNSTFANDGPTDCRISIKSRDAIKHRTCIRGARRGAVDRATVFYWTAERLVRHGSLATTFDHVCLRRRTNVRQ